MAVVTEDGFHNCCGEFSHSQTHMKSCAFLEGWTLILGIINQATNNSVKTQKIKCFPTEKPFSFNP